jgi:hypothetical protein
MKRPAWLLAGVVLGAGGALWAESRVRREIRRVAERIEPQHVVSQTVRSARRMSERVRDAADTARVERELREAELWSDLRREPVPQPGGVLFGLRQSKKVDR